MGRACACMRVDPWASVTCSGREGGQAVRRTGSSGELVPWVTPDANLQATLLDAPREPQSGTLSPLPGFWSAEETQRCSCNGSLRDTCGESSARLVHMSAGVRSGRGEAECAFGYSGSAGEKRKRGW